MLNIASIKRLLGLSSDRKTVSPKLVASSRAQLSSSLRILPPGGLGWIGFDDIARLFSPNGKELGRLDNLGTFAAEHRCEVQVEPAENRAYFAKIGIAPATLPLSI